MRGSYRTVRIVEIRTYSSVSACAGFVIAVGSGCTICVALTLGYRIDNAAINLIKEESHV